MLLFVVLGHIAFLTEWSSGGFSIISEPLSFARFYQEFFADRGYFVGWTLILAATAIAFGHGLLRRRKWAWWPGMALVVSNVFFYGWAMTNGNLDLSMILQLGIAGYMFWVLSAIKVRQEFNFTN